MSEKIELEQRLLIGEGDMRACYQHPDDEDKCIKVYHLDIEAEKSQSTKKSRRNKKTHDKEVQELIRVSSKKMRLAVPKYYGEVETSLGKGYIYELIKHKGKVPESITYWIQGNAEKAPLLKKALLKELLDSGVVIAELHCLNVLVMEEDSGELNFALIDGVGEGTMLKLCSWFPYFARKKCLRKWDRLSEELDELVRSRKTQGAIG